MFSQSILLSLLSYQFALNCIMEIYKSLINKIKTVDGGFNFDL